MSFKESFNSSKILFKQSLKILFDDKTLLVFPILSLILTLSIVIILIIPLFGINFIVSFFPALEIQRQSIVLVIFILYFLIYYIGVFFSAALVGAAKQSLEGVNTTVGTGLKIAWDHKFQLLKWTVVAATVGVILKRIRKMNVLGSIISGVGAIAWHLINYFIIPILVFEHLNIKDSITRSKNLFIKTWGTNLISAVGIGLVGGLGFFATIGIIILAAMLGLFKIMIFLIFILLPTWIILMSTLGAIFNTALYIYASTGKIPAGYSPELIQNAFKKKST